MIPLTLRVQGVRGFRNETIPLGLAHDGRVLIFGINGSGKSTLVMCLKLVLGHEVERLAQNYLPYGSENQISRTARIELDILNPENRFYKADWPAQMTLGVEFGLQYNRVFRLHYFIKEGLRQDITRIGDLREILGRDPLFISTEDAMMFVTQGQITRYIDTTPHRRYEELKEILGVEDLERKWEEAIDQRKEAHRHQADALLVLRKAEEILAGRRRLKEQFEQREHHRAEAARLWNDYYQHGAVQNARRITELRQEQTVQTSAHAVAAAELAQTQAEQARLEREQAERSGEQQRLQSQVEALESTIAGHTRRFNQFEAEVNRLENETQGLADLPQRLPPRQQTQAALESLHLELAARQAEQQDLSTRDQAETAAQTTLAQQVGAVRLEIEQAQAEITRREAAVANLPSQTQVAAEREALEVRWDRLGQQQVALTDDITRREAELVRLREHQVNLPEAVYDILAQYPQAVALAEVLEVADPAHRDFVEAALRSLRGAILTPDGVLHPYADYTIHPSPSFPRPLASRPSPPLPDDAQTLLPYVQIRDDAPPFARELAQATLRSIRVEPDWRPDLVLDGNAAIATQDRHFVDHFGVRFTATEEYTIGRLGYEQAVERQERELAEARLTHQAIQQERERLRQQREQNEAAWQRWQDYTRIPNYRRQATAAQIRVAQLEAEQAAISERLTTLDTQQAVLQQTIGRLESRRTDLAAILEQWAHYDALADLITQLETARHVRTEARRERDAARQQQESLTERIRELTNAQAIGEAQLQNIRGRAARQQAEVERLVERLKTLATQIEGYQEVGRPFFAEMAARQTDLQQALETNEAASATLLAWLVETYPDLSEVSETQIITWKNEAEVHERAAEALRDIPHDAVEMYETALAEAEARRQVMDEANRVAEYWESQEEQTRRDFEQMVNAYFRRINERFQTYLEAFGWYGSIERHPRGGTRFDLEVLVSVEPERVVPTPVTIDSKSSGERAAIGFALALAILKEFPRPFYVFDELDQNLDDINVGVVLQLLADHLPEQKVLFFTPKLRGREIVASFDLFLSVAKNHRGRSYCKVVRFKEGGGLEAVTDEGASANG
ncbi:MAG: AAA family ATPase [Anaerolineae bacterium]|nr:AAA family ATPase [Anaerolineae bacterium]